MKREFPRIIKKATTVRCETREYKINGTTLLGHVTVMPDGVSELVWLPWPECVREPPPIEKLPEQHEIVVYGKKVAQPRHTLCYDHVYPYSGVDHPIEPTTPPEITAMYEATNQLFGYGEDEGVNMCLLNVYWTGYQCIGEHSDDKRSFGNNNDVVCWVTGPASREVIFRHKKGTKQGDRMVLRIAIPRGIYVMRGRQFQANYTHEIPRYGLAIFKKAAEAFADAPKESCARAVWLKEHAEEVRASLKTDKDRTAFDIWCRGRESYTLRNFVVTKKQRRE